MAVALYISFAGSKIKKSLNRLPPQQATGCYVDRNKSDSMKKKEVKEKNGAVKAPTKNEASGKMNFEKLEYMKKSFKDLEKHGVIEYKPESEVYGMTAKCEEVIYKFLRKADLDLFLLGFWYKESLRPTEFRLELVVKRLVAIHVLEKFGLCQANKKYDARDMCTVEYMSWFVKARHVRLYGQN